MQREPEEDEAPTDEEEDARLLDRPQEELQLQAGMGVRYGFDDSNLEAVRGLTIVPAETARIGHLVGSIEPGKHADLLFISGHPADPRSSVETVFIEGQKVYNPAVQVRRW